MRHSLRSRLALASSVVIAVALLLSAPARTYSARGWAPEDDLYLLAKVIFAEAAGEPYEGKVAVGAVVVNRTRSGIFPTTIAGVVYEPWQFSCVGNWMFNSRPDQASLSAASDALNGIDPTDGALYYFNYHLVDNAWLWSRPFAAVIGNHWFTY